MEMLRIEDVTKKYDRTLAVKNLSFTLESGKIYGFLGPNGSGKTTLMKMVVGLIQPTKGKIFIHGNERSTATKADIAYMTTENFIYEHMNIRRVGEFYQDFYADFDFPRYEQLIHFMALDMNMNVASLSSGMNAKLRTAVTMSRRAKLYLLYEPLNGIDIIAREKIMKAIVETATDDNTIVISSHLVDELEKILDHVIFLKEGELALIGHADEVREERGKSIVDLYKEVYADVESH